MALYTSHIWSFTVPNSLRIKYLDSITLTVISIPNVDLLILTKSLGSGCVAQLVERSLPIPDVHSSNPVISKIY